MEMKKIRKSKWPSMPKGIAKADLLETCRFGSGRVGSGQIFVKGRKCVRTYISMVETLLRREEKLEQADPNREHVVSSVNDGADELKIRTYVWGDELKE